MLFRHKVFYTLLRPPVMLFLKLKFGYSSELAGKMPGNYIVLANHNTDYDMLMVGASFRRQMYFVASEHIARWGFLSKLLQYAFAPIVRYKGSLAASTVLDIKRKIRAGDNVCIFAEGVRSWDGVTSPILPSTGSLIKSARCDLITYKIVGGYFASPNWSESNTRRGYLHGAPVAVYTKEQLADMSVDEINEIIRRDLHEDAYARQLASPMRYRGKNLAVRMENLLFICPHCKKMDSIVSEGNEIRCTQCGKSFFYDEFGMLSGIPFRTVKELSDWQKEEVRKAAGQNAVFTAGHAVLSEIEKHEEVPVDQGEVSLSGEHLRCGETVIPLSEIIDLAMHGRHALVFSAGKRYYELIPDIQHNTLKFLLLYKAYTLLNKNQNIEVS